MQHKHIVKTKQPRFGLCRVDVVAAAAVAAAVAAGVERTKGDVAKQTFRVASPASGDDTRI